MQIPKAKKKTVKLISFIALLGSARVKAARRTLVILTLGDNDMTPLSTLWHDTVLGVIVKF